jgi:hypothetical protein
MSTSISKNGDSSLTLEERDFSLNNVKFLPSAADLSWGVLFIFEQTPGSRL